MGVEQMLKLAVLDIGSNSIHMILTEIQPDFSYKILDRFKDVPRLGEETFTTGSFSSDAIGKGTEVVRTLATLAHNRGFTRIEAVATSAVREAANGGDLIEAIEHETGIQVRVVTGLEEARLIYLGVRHSMDFGDSNVLIVDVGGGSVELIVGNRHTLLHAASLKLGAIRLNDLYLKKDTSSDALKRLEKAVEAQLKPTLPRFKKVGFEKLVGTSGMIGNLAEVMHLQKTGRPLPQLNLASFSVKDVRELENLLLDTPLKRRAEIPHDIGYLINSRQHHKHSYYLIKNSDLAGFTADEIELIANVARYHRRAIPEGDHKTLKDLDPTLREPLSVLSGILRLGDALDRTHFGVIHSLSCSVSPAYLDIALSTTDDAALELWAARDRKDLLAQGLNRTIRFTTTPTHEDPDA